MEFPETRGSLGWMAIVAIFFLLGLVTLLRGGKGDWSAVLIPFGMLLFYWLMIQGSFWMDAPTSRRLITQILSGSNELRHVGS
jgi:hypothetical protein